MKETTKGTTLVDGGYLMWTYGVDTWKRQGWQTAKWDYATSEGVILVLDGGSGFRQEFDPTYKSGRRDKYKDDEDRQAKKDSVIFFVEKILKRDPTLTVVQYEGLEADDVIAAWTIRHPTHLKVIGRDKDLIQLGKRNILLKTHQGDKITVERFAKSLPKTIQPYVTKAEHILLCLACMGDKSDSIPRIVPAGLKALKQFALILQDPDPWGKALEEYGLEVTHNLYLSVLPGPWVFERIPSPTEVFRHIRYNPAMYYQAPLRKDLEDDYQRLVTIKKSADTLLMELGY